MGEKKTVVFAADNNYACQMIIAVCSLLSSLRECRDYQLVLLVSSDFKEENVEKINSIAEKYGAPSPDFHFMSDEYSEIEMQLAHISRATYFRLKLPEILPDVSKCIYLDVDVLVRKSIDGLFSLDMADYYLAGVKAAGFYYPEEKGTALAEKLEIPRLDQYINAGVLIINLDLMRKNRLMDKFDELIAEKFKNQDQDILNAACYGKIKILDPEYNLMTKYAPLDESSYDKLQCLQKCYSKEAWEKACQDPVIIHFADVEKPWLDISSNYAEIWWEYAVRCGISEYLLEKNLKDIHEKPVKKIKRLESHLEETNRKLQITYDEKAQRGREIKKLQAEKKKLLQAVKEKEDEIGRLRQEISQKDGQIKKIYSSRSYKVGRIVTFVPRRLKGLVKRT